jgi:hypothetical protein
MYAIIQKVNALSGSIHSMNSQLNELTKKVYTDTTTTESNEHDAKIVGSKVDDLKSAVNKMQIEVVSKNNELKRDIELLRKDDIKRELSKASVVLETTVAHKMEQTINKVVKDRMERMMDELKLYVDKRIEEKMDATPEGP